MTSTTTRSTGPKVLRAKMLGLMTASCDLRWILALLVALYSLGYEYSRFTPGKSAAYPLGWWGWTDQSHYLTSAKALAQFDFTPARHFYPPLYAALGAPFTALSEYHAFWLVDLACLLWFAAVFVLFATRYVGRVVAVSLLLGSVVASYTIFDAFVTPWTSTLSAALLSTVIYGLLRLENSRYGTVRALRSPSVAGAFMVSAASGFLVLARPLDAVVGGVMWLGYLWTVRQSMLQGGGRQFRLDSPPFLAATAGYAIGPAVFVGFNWLVFGKLSGTYFYAATANGYFPFDLAEKFVSIFLDSYSLYLEPGAGIVAHYPWLILSFIGVVWILWRGDVLLRIVAAATMIQVALYLPYGDLLPNGVWRYLNIHYFKWLFPYFALFGWLVVAGVVLAWRRHAALGLACGAGVAVAACALAGLQFQPQSHGVTQWVPTGTDVGGKHSGYITLPDQSIDMVDLAGLNGSFEAVYFGNHKVRLDGRSLQVIRDFRVLPAPWGVRLLFLRPIRGTALLFEPDPRLNRQTGAEVRVVQSTYRFVVRYPFAVLEREASAPFPYALGEVIEFSSRGNSDWYVRRGWSIAESWGGRWTDAAVSRVHMRLAEPTEQPLTLRLHARAFVSPGHPRQDVDVVDNGHIVAHLVFRLENGGADGHRVDVALAPGVIGDDGQLLLEFRSSNAAAPKQVGMGDDARTLGLGLTSLSIIPSASGVSK